MALQLPLHQRIHLPLEDLYRHQALYKDRGLSLLKGDLYLAPTHRLPHHPTIVHHIPSHQLLHPLASRQTQTSQMVPDL